LRFRAIKQNQKYTFADYDAKPLVVGMDEVTPVNLFADLTVDWDFLLEQKQQSF